MDDCNHLGEHVGQAKSCCGRPTTDVHRCNSTSQPLDYCSRHRDDFTDHITLTTGETKQYRVASCQRCPHHSDKPPHTVELASKTSDAPPPRIAEPPRITPVLVPQFVTHKGKPVELPYDPATDPQYAHITSRTGRRLEHARQMSALRPPSTLQESPTWQRLAEHHNHKPGSVLDRHSATDCLDADIYLDSNDHGYGDAIIFSAVAEAAKLQGIKIAHYAVGPMKDLLLVFGQNVISTKPPQTRNINDAYFPEAAARGRVAALDNRHRWLGITARDCWPRPTVRDEVSQWATQTMGDKGVLLFPRATRLLRIWPTPYWIDLDTLLRDRGYMPHFCVWNSEREHHDDQIGRYASNVFVGLNWEHVVALMQHCQFVIGNNSGPVHVSGTLGKLSFVLSGLTTPESLIGFSSMIHVSVTQDEIPCLGCYYQRPPFRESCISGCQALYLLTPQRVMDTIATVSETYQPNTAVAAIAP